ncbi:MAG: CpsD/CapB family tyrosine-protein kinase [Anaerolineae bacterium]
MTELITLTDPRSSTAEAYRVLRTNIQFAASEKPIGTLLVAAAAADDGKSVAAANLAVTLAQSGHTTLVVDADFRRPTQHTLWGVSNERGLLSLLQSNNSLNDLPLQKTTVEHLMVLTSGGVPANPADLVGSKRMGEVITALKAQADYVIFDAPPILAAADAALLAVQVDAVLMIVRAGETRRDHAARAKEALSRIHAHILGVALTNAPRDASLNLYGKG